MLDFRRPAAAGAAVLFLLSGAVPAFADAHSSASGTVDITPGKAWPGAVISLHVKSACSAANRAKASAEVFVNTVTLAPPADGQDGLVSDASIRSDVAPGTYAVSVECDGNSHAAEGTVVIINNVNPEPVWPTAPVPAGGGGTAQLAAGPAEAGPGTNSVLAAGGAAAVTLAGVAVYRRRRHG